MGLPTHFCTYTTAITVLILLGEVSEASGVCHYHKQDFTLIPQGSGKKVVEATVGKIQNSGIFPDDCGFLRRIAYVESKDGNDLKTYRKGYYGGIWQVDEIGFYDTQNTTAHPKLKDKFAKSSNASESTGKKSPGRIWRNHFILGWLLDCSYRTKIQRFHVTQKNKLNTGRIIITPKLEVVLLKSSLMMSINLKRETEN